MGLRVIDRDTVARLLTYEACVPLMREAMTALSQGRTSQLLRQILPVDGQGVLGVMPGAANDAFGAKLISVYPGNFAKGLKSHQGGVMLFEAESGAPVAIVQAGEITAIRTACASAAATDVLARPEASVLALLGYGEQALTHARAMCVVRPIGEIRVWGRSIDKATALAARLSLEHDVPAWGAARVADAVDGADIICAVSAAREPILFGADAGAGVHVNLAGASGLGPREADETLIAKARVFADHREGVLTQSGEIAHALKSGLISENHVLGEIGEVMAGTLPGRTRPADVTLYKSLGAIAQDLYSAWYVYQRAVAEGLGTDAPF